MHSFPSLSRELDGGNEDTLGLATFSCLHFLGYEASLNAYYTYLLGCYLR